MKKLHIAIGTKTKVLTELEKFYDISYYKELTFFEKLLLKDHKPIDIYFHQGSLTTKALDMIEKSKFTIVNSHTIHQQIVEKRATLSLKKIYPLHPYHTAQTEYDKKLKKSFKKEHGIEKKDAVFLLSGKKLFESGFENFLRIVSTLQNQHFTIVVNSNTQELEQVKQRLSFYKLDQKARVFENYPSIDTLFVASDIFILPTKQKLFSLDVLKALYLRNSVFLTMHNAASEILDPFSLINGENDQTVGFKIEALLQNKKELKKIQKENHNRVKDMNFSTYIQKIQALVENNF